MTGGSWHGSSIEYLFDQDFEHLRCDRMERCAFVVNGDLFALFESVCEADSSNSKALGGRIKWYATRATCGVLGLVVLKQLHAARISGEKLEPMP